MNGSAGELIGYEKSSSGQVTRLYLHFFDEKVGKNRRKNAVETPYLRQLRQTMPDKLPTPIDKLEFSYSPTKTAFSTSVKNTALQFPVRLAWAMTMHRVQGQTVKKPNKILVSMRNIFAPAMAYVALSRIENINQLILLDDVFPEQIYSNDEVLEELDKLEKKSKKAASALSETQVSLQVLSLNIRSLNKHFEDLIKEREFEHSDLVLVQQTCLTANSSTDKFEVESHSRHFNSVGNGKGLAVFFKESFKHEIDVKKDKYQMSKFQSADIDVITVYRSTDNSQVGIVAFLKDLNEILNPKKRTAILGDFNISFPDNPISRELMAWDFKQLVEYPSHIEGNIIDHIYISDKVNPELVVVDQHPVFYSDHDLFKFYVLEAPLEN